METILWIAVIYLLFRGNSASMQSPSSGGNLGFSTVANVTQNGNHSTQNNYKMPVIPSSGPIDVWIRKGGFGSGQ